ncbi:MAG TPA: teichoic acid D-Ala incorporation-associated protein DltX [Chloroflexota bacterium]|nr:teichoic acid D-Ala incorporation-associated protein DltX [Chloroflexota bacterium]
MNRLATASGGRLAVALSRLQRVWGHDLVRLPVLTAYYLAIIVGLIFLYGGATYTPPPFIYQGF